MPCWCLRRTDRLLRPAPGGRIRHLRIGNWGYNLHMLSCTGISEGKRGSNLVLARCTSQRRYFTLNANSDTNLWSWYVVILELKWETNFLWICFRVRSETGHKEMSWICFADCSIVVSTLCCVRNCACSLVDIRQHTLTYFWFSSISL